MTKTDKKSKIAIILMTLICCIVMGIVETFIEPSYFVKSATKVVLFLAVPLIAMKVLDIKAFDSSFAIKKKTLLKLLLLGAAIYTVVFAAYLVTKNVFDYSSMVVSLSEDQHVNSKNFIWIAAYISFGNSFIEEFLFRLISFIRLSEHVNKKTAYIFSSLTFALYHIAFIGPSFPLPLLLLSVFGLAVGGFIFDKVDDKSRNIYNSWIIHMFADLALMTIWFIHI